MAVIYNGAMPAITKAASVEINLIPTFYTTKTAGLYTVECKLQINNKNYYELSIKFTRTSFTVSETGDKSQLDYTIFFQYVSHILLSPHLDHKLLQE
jgi:hypothetical protein